MDFTLSELHRDIRAMAARFVDEDVVPHARQWDRDEQVNPAVVARLGELGFLGLGISERYGGTEVDMLGYALICEELGRGDSSVRGIVSVSLGLVAKTIAKHGTEDQKAHWLPQLVSGQALGCFALTEPDSGSDPRSLRTTARQDGNDWIIDGAKIFITNGTWAKVALVFAKTTSQGSSGITAFLVPTDTDGFVATEVKGKLGLRGQATAAITLTGLRVPDSARVGAVGRGLSIALAALTLGRISVAAGAVGVAQAALNAALIYAKNRIQFGRPIAAKQLVQRIIADSAVETESARLLTWRAASLADGGRVRKNWPWLRPWRNSQPANARSK